MENPYGIPNEDLKRVWTPCSHFSQCIGFCPMCLSEYNKESDEQT